MKHDTVLLAVKQTSEVIQTGDGGIEYLTKADLSSGGTTGGATAAKQDISNTALANILTAVSSRYSFAETIWVDSAGVYWKSMVYQDPVTFAITTKFTTPQGVDGTPTGNITPAANANVTTIPSEWEVLTAGTGYSVGDNLINALVAQTVGGAVVANFWFNIKTGLVVPTANIDITKLERANEKVTVTTNSGFVSPTLTVTASAYSAGNVVGGLLTLTNILNTTKNTGLLNSIHLESKVVSTNTYRVFIFNANPSSSTFTDKAAPNINAADFNKVVGYFDLDAPASNLGTHTVWNKDGISKVIKAASSGTLYAVIIAISAFTPATTSEMSITFGCLQD